MKTLYFFLTLANLAGIVAQADIAPPPSTREALKATIVQLDVNPAHTRLAGATTGTVLVHLDKKIVELRLQKQLRCPPRQRCLEVFPVIERIELPLIRQSGDRFEAQEYVAMRDQRPVDGIYQEIKVTYRPFDLSTTPTHIEYTTRSLRGRDLPTVSTFEAGHLSSELTPPRAHGNVYVATLGSIELDANEDTSLMGASTGTLIVNQAYKVITLVLKKTYRCGPSPLPATRCMGAPETVATLSLPLVSSDESGVVKEYKAAQDLGRSEGPYSQIHVRYNSVIRSRYPTEIEYTVNTRGRHTVSRFTATPLVLETSTTIPMMKDILVGALDKAVSESDRADSYKTMHAKVTLDPKARTVELNLVRRFQCPPNAFCTQVVRPLKSETVRMELISKKNRQLWRKGVHGPAAPLDGRKLRRPHRENHGLLRLYL